MKHHPISPRQHPILSPVAIGSTLLLIAGLGIGVLLKGGVAFNPGELSGLSDSRATLAGFSSHADFAEDCSRCHAPFQGIQAELCEQCHEEITTQRERNIGVHGKIEAAEECARCHLDHHGPEFDLLTTALTHFDHEVTGFSLALHKSDYAGLSIDCTACHTRERDFSLRTAACTDCHESEAPDFMKLHVTAYSSECATCHDGIDTLADFSRDDHDELFPLEGAHSAASCEACHTDAQFGRLPQECAGCHEDPTVHTGLFNVDCADCHTTSAWRPALLLGQRFDHSLTRFSLAQHNTSYGGKSFTCLSCHTVESFVLSETSCVTCHAPAQPDFIQEHIEAVGQECFNCHDGSGELTGFDHAAVWPLEGRHRALACLDCHTGSTSSESPRACVACHEEPAVHQGLFGTDCASCHTADAWLPAQLTRHSFPLDHGENWDIPCATCHTGTYTEYTCYGCHEHDPMEIASEHQKEGIVPPELANCVQCHPTGEEGDIESD